MTCITVPSGDWKNCILKQWCTVSAASFTDYDADFVYCSNNVYCALQYYIDACSQCLACTN